MAIVSCHDISYTFCKQYSEGIRRLLPPSAAAPSLSVTTLTFEILGQSSGEKPAVFPVKYTGTQKQRKTAATRGMAA